MSQVLLGDVGRYRTGDGPGIRTVLFFKGCPLTCPWCHNPEFINFVPEIAFYDEKCIGCGECIQVCPQQAIKPHKTDRIDRIYCDGCRKCAEACPSRALRLVGQLYEIEDIIELVLLDRAYYQTSGGGVTLSGGEPTSQMEGAAKILIRLRGESIHTAIETSGFFNWNIFHDLILDQLDLIYFDIKLADSYEHFSHIGQHNTLIWENLQKIAALRPNDLIVRIPLIPGFTTDKKNIRAIAERIHKFGVRRHELLAYHPMGRDKRARIGDKPVSGLPDWFMTKEERNVFESYFNE